MFYNMLFSLLPGNPILLDPLILHARYNKAS